jgi:glycine cleavage system H protein
VSGEILAINQAVVDAPESINSAPYDNWLFRIKPANPDELNALLDADGYNATL